MSVVSERVTVSVFRRHFFRFATWQNSKSLKDIKPSVKGSKLSNRRTTVIKALTPLFQAHNNPFI